MTPAACRIHLRITGRVQGVFYRASISEAAVDLSASGWARNNADGSVEAVAEAPREALEALIAWCRVGPPAARVDAVEAVWSEALGELNGWSTRYDG